MFIAHVGSGELIHRIARAMFFKGAAEGSAFCGAEGKVIFVESGVITCDKCRDTLIPSMLPEIKGSGKGGR